MCNASKLFCVLNNLENTYFVKIFPTKNTFIYTIDLQILFNFFYFLLYLLQGYRAKGTRAQNAIGSKL